MKIFTPIDDLTPGGRGLVPPRLFREAIMRILMLCLVVLCGCGGGGDDSCSIVSASGNNSQAACSTGGGIDQVVDQSGSGDEDELDPICAAHAERVCLGRGNPSAEPGDACFDEYYDDCFSGIVDDPQDFGAGENDEEQEEVDEVERKARA